MMLTETDWVGFAFIMTVIVCGTWFRVGWYGWGQLRQIKETAEEHGFNGNDRMLADYVRTHMSLASTTLPPADLFEDSFIVHFRKAFVGPLCVIFGLSLLVKASGALFWASLGILVLGVFLIGYNIGHATGVKKGLIKARFRKR